MAIKLKRDWLTIEVKDEAINDQLTMLVKAIDEKRAELDARLKFKICFIKVLICQMA